MRWELSRRLPLKGLAIVLLLAACGTASADDFFEGHWIREEAKRRGITLISSEQARKIAVDRLGGGDFMLKDLDLDNEADDYPNGTAFRPVYQMELRSGWMEYDVDVDAVTGQVLKVRRDD